METKPVLEVEQLSKWFETPPTLLQRLRRKPSERLYAVSDVSFQVREREILGLVGESGCGKTTLGRTLARLYEPSVGSMRFRGADVATLSGAALRDFRRRMQMIFQDPFSSLNPRMTVRSALGEAIQFHGRRQGRAVDARIDELMLRVGLSPADAQRYPRAFSGGQRQRIGFARALAVEPDFVIADEPVSALDVSIQASILNLLQDLQQDFGLSMIFIAHDLGVIRYLCDRVAVMYLGRIVECAPSRQLFAMPAHPYTAALLSAIPKLNPRERQRVSALQGEPPSPFERPLGCPFAGRCPEAQAVCRESRPELKAIGADHVVACHLR
jgi:oligopeptide/dipeptide ABC transporter ATP-binding protein